MSENLSRVNEYFSSIKGRFTPTQSLMLSIAEHLKENAKNNIETQGANIPGGWPQRKMFPGKRLLSAGNLIRSIQSAATDNKAIAFTNNKGAALQNFGGVVKAKKLLGSVKRKKDVWAMEQYFWMRYYKTKKQEKLFMVIALHVHKYGSVTVPASPFMVITKDYENKIIEEIKKHVAG